jgi:hypothetical protein
MNNQIENKLPNVNSSVPVPNSISFFSRHKEYVGQNSPFLGVVEKAQRAIIQNIDGNRCLDKAFASQSVTGYNSRG